MRPDPNEAARLRAHYLVQNSEEEAWWRSQSVSPSISGFASEALLAFEDIEVVGPHDETLVLRIGSVEDTGEIRSLSLHRPRAGEGAGKSLSPSEEILMSWIVVRKMPPGVPLRTPITALEELAGKRAGMTPLERQRRLSEAIVHLRNPSEFATALFVLEELVRAGELVQVT